MACDTKFLKNIIDSNKIKILIVLMIVFNIIYIPAHSFSGTFFDNFFVVDNSLGFNIVLIISILFATTTTISMFEEYDFIIIRCKTKKEYLKKLISFIVMINLILLITHYMIMIILLFLNSYGFIVKKYIYGLPNYVYLIWSVIKKIIACEFLSVLFALVTKNVIKPYNVIINFVLCLLIFAYPYIDNEVTSLSNIFIFYWEYFVYHRYSSFVLEVSAFGFYHSLYAGLLLLMYHFTLKKMKNITN